MDSSSCTLRGCISGCIPCCHTLNWPQKNPLKMGVIVALIFVIGALVAYYGAKAKIGWPIGLASTGFVAGLGVSLYYYKKAKADEETPFQTAITEMNLTQAISLLTVEELQNNPHLLCWATTAAVAYEEQPIPNRTPQLWIAFLKKIDQLDPTLKNKVAGEYSKTPLKFVEWAKTEALRNVFSTP